MTTRKIVHEVIAEVSAELFVSTYGHDGQGFRLDAWTPRGYVWTANDAHCLVSDNNGEGGRTWAWRDMYDRLSCGMDRCAAALAGDCEVCDDESPDPDDQLYRWASDLGKG